MFSAARINMGNSSSVCTGLAMLMTGLWGICGHAHNVWWVLSAELLLYIESAATHISQIATSIHPPT